MRIQTKLVISAIAVVGITALAISYTSLQFTQRNELRQVDRELRRVTVVEDPNSEDFINPAVKAAEKARKRIYVSVITADGFQIQFDDRKEISLAGVSRATLRAAAVEPVTVDVEGVPFRLSTINLGGGDFLTAVTSLKLLHEIYDENLQSFLWITFVSVVIAGSVIGYVTRRELQEIEKVVEFSESVSRGNLDAKFKGRNRSPEIIQLTSSLDHMISSLADSIKKERELQTSMKDFLGDASHELKTPLTVIKGYNELLVSQRSRMSEESIVSAHANITTQIERMDALVKDLLLLTEIESSNEIDFQRLNFTELIEWLVEEFTDRNSDRAVSVDLAEDVAVEGSERLLSRMVTNILRNIEVHTPADAPVSVELRVTESSRDRVAVLTIGDGGPGLPADSYGRGIQGFRRFDASRSRGTGGTGLGMSIIGSVTERHQGDIQLKPSPLGGLEIEIQLPLEVAASI